jgi:hypothetical protein
VFFYDIACHGVDHGAPHGLVFVWVKWRWCDGTCTPIMAMHLLVGTARLITGVILVFFYFFPWGQGLWNFFKKHWDINDFLSSYIVHKLMAGKVKEKKLGIWTRRSPTSHPWRLCCCFNSTGSFECRVFVDGKQRRSWRCGRFFPLDFLDGYAYPRWSTYRVLDSDIYYSPRTICRASVSRNALDKHLHQR